ncbi:MAG: NnrS family protein [Thiothrix sp.]
MIKLDIQPPVTGKYALSHLGFRPFFLGAGLFAVIGMVLWAGIYGFGWQGLHPAYPSIAWHAHEMVFGYAVAVAAGFLLTAIKNWTGQQTLHGRPLLGLAGVWLLARILPFTGLPLLTAAVADVVFMLWLLWAAVQPVVRARQWQQVGIVSKIALLLLANLTFYFGLLGYWPVGLTVGLYAGFYLIVALILTMGRRVIPFFIERGLGCPFEARNHVWVDRAGLILFLAFVVAELFALAGSGQDMAWVAAVLALEQVPLHGVRLWGWHHANLWRKPLLWVLYLAYGWLVLGFLLKFLAVAAGVSPWLAVHAFAYGGIGIMTVGMMARVILGHTGRNVFEPPGILSVIFLLLFAGAVIRVFAVWWLPQFHGFWILASQLVWIAAFLVFVWTYAPMLLRVRVDGRYG